MMKQIGYVVIVKSENPKIYYVDKDEALSIIKKHLDNGFETKDILLFNRLKGG